MMTGNVTMMTYKEALKEFGLNRVPGKDKLKKLYKKLVLKEHPDIKPASQRKSATDKIKRINMAYAILSSPKEVFTRKDLGPYYRMIASRLSPRPSDEEIEKIYVSLVKTKRFRSSIDDSKLLLKASEMMKRNLEFQDALHALARERSKKAFKNNFFYNLMSKEEKRIFHLKEAARKKAFSEFISNVNRKLGMLRRAVRLKKGKARVPVKVKNDKGRDFKRFILITGAFVLAYLTGKYTYDKISGSFKKKLPKKMITYSRNK